MEKPFRINENGYPEGKPEHSPAIHRQVAYKEIYLKNKDKYPKPWIEYVIHHIDGEKLNGSVKNLYICTKKEHNWIHSEQIERRKRFLSSKEIDIFLINKKAEGTAKLSFTQKIEKPISQIKATAYFSENPMPYGVTYMRENNFTFSKKREVKKPINNEKLNYERKFNDWNIAEVRRHVDNEKGRGKDIPQTSKEKEDKTKILRNKREIIHKLKRNTLLLFDYLKKSLFLCIMLIIGLFLFPLVYYAIIYLIYFLSMILYYLLIWILSLLFSYKSNLLPQPFEKLLGILLNLIMPTPPLVWNFIYGTNTRPVLVIVLIIFSFIISLFFKRNKRL